MKKKQSTKMTCQDGAIVTQYIKKTITHPDTIKKRHI